MPSPSLPNSPFHTILKAEHHQVLGVHDNGKPGDPGRVEAPSRYPFAGGGMVWDNRPSDPAKASE